VSITLPCVAGPYSGVNATLTLVSHAVRRDGSATGNYLPSTDDNGIPVDGDTRFWKGVGAVRSVAISHGQEDAALFELSFHDERFLPFEGLGAVSHWHLELPADCNRFDLSTVSDVIMHLRYTARDGGTALRDAAREAVIEPMPKTGAILLSAQQDFPMSWARLWAPAGAGQALSFPFEDRQFPFVSPDEQLQIASVSVFLLFARAQSYVDYAAGAMLAAHLGPTTTDGSPAQFVPDPAVAKIPLAAIALAGNVGPWSLTFDEAAIATVPLLDLAETDPDGTVHQRLNQQLIEDVLVLVAYQVVKRP